MHDCFEGLGVGLHGCGCIGGRGVDGVALGIFDVGVFGCVVFHPSGHIVVAAVLPGGEPKED